MRFRLSWLLLAFVALSVVMGGLASPNEWRASGAALTVALWLLATLALAIGSAGRARACWAAMFAVCLLFHSLAGNTKLIGMGAHPFSGGLLTTKLLMEVFDITHGRARRAQVALDLPPLPGFSPAQAIPAPPSSIPVVSVVHFVTVGNAFFSLVLSLAGGRLAGWAYDRRKVPDEQAHP